MDPSDSCLLAVGSYGDRTVPAIQLISLNLTDSSLSLVAQYSGVEAPSFLIVGHSGRVLYAVSEIPKGEVVSLRLSSDYSSIREVDRQFTLGSLPCYVMYDDVTRGLYVTNYLTGSVCRYSVSSDGAISTSVEKVEFYGNGPIKARQEGSHPHSVAKIPGSRRVIVSDLGTDCLHILEYSDGHVSHCADVRGSVASGPRHMTWDRAGRYLYVANELSSTISVFEMDYDMNFTLTDETPTTPDYYTDENAVADIHLHPTGRFVYVSNRGHDSIATFSVVDGGQLKLIAYTQTGGVGPRNFLITPGGRNLVIANTVSGNITSALINHSGVPVLTQNEFRMTQPSCLELISRKVTAAHEGERDT